MHSFPTTVGHWTIAHVHKRSTLHPHPLLLWVWPWSGCMFAVGSVSTQSTTAHCQVRRKANSTYVCMYVCTYQMDGINSSVQCTRGSTHKADYELQYRQLAVRKKIYRESRGREVERVPSWMTTSRGINQLLRNAYQHHTSCHRSDL